MGRSECPFEQDLLDAFATSRWPDRCDGDLRAHAHACAICRDVVDAVGPLVDERDLFWDGIQVPAAGAVWHRACLRARQEAVRRVARPLTVAQGVAFVSVLALAGTLGVVLAPAAGAWTTRALELLSIDLPRLGLPDVSMTHPLWSVVLAVACAWMLLAPVAIYLAFREE